MIAISKQNLDLHIFQHSQTLTRYDLGDFLSLGIKTKTEI